jgi:hypothetical protein
VSPLAEAAVDKGTFAINGQIDGPQAEVTLRGQADTRHKKELDRFLAVVAAEAARLALEKVRVDLSTLEFMSSSCIKGFVNWIGDLHALPADRRYSIVFVANPTAAWQRRTLQALVTIGADLVSVAS